MNDADTIRFIPPVEARLAAKQSAAFMKQQKPKRLEQP